MPKNDTRKESCLVPRNQHFLQTGAQFIARITARMLLCWRLVDMKKRAFLISIFAVLFSVALCAPAYAGKVNNPAKNSAKAARDDRKMQRKQAKAMKKYLKAEKKAQQKMIKKDRKNTHLPSHY